MIVEDERAGKVYFGKIGSIVEVNGDEVTLNFNPGVDCINSSYLADLKELQPLKKLQKMIGSLTAFVNVYIYTLYIYICNYIWNS